MVVLTQKKRIVLLISGLLSALLFAAGVVSPVFASAKITTGSRANPAGILLAVQHSSKSWPGTGPGSGDQQNGQFVRGNGQIKNQFYRGVNQGNDGNQGLNRGYNQDNSSNNGNQVINQKKKIDSQENKQIVRGSNSGTNNSVFVGANQGNDGNQGLNQGNNQDNSGNNGNQVNNQGNIIGMQVNAPGTQVNNQGSTIIHQTNSLQLLPDLSVGLSLFPRARLDLGLSR